MNCPVCHAPLQPTERQGVEIDFCPQCRGVWLDRGELDKIIERSQSYYQGRSSQQESYPQHQSRPYHQEEYRDPRHRKREGFLSELFDWD